MGHRAGWKVFCNSYWCCVTVYFLLNLAAYLFVIPAQAGIQAASHWTPAYAGVTIIYNLIISGILVSVRASIRCPTVGAHLGAQPTVFDVNTNL